MSNDAKCIEFAKQIKDLREYGPFAKDLARDEVANALEALLEIVTERSPSTANGLAPEWATLATHLAMAAGRPIGDLTPTNIGHVAKEAAYCATNLDHRVTELKGAVTTLRAEVTDLRRQKTDIETALGAAVTGWNKDKDTLLKTRLTLGMAPRGADHVESVAAQVMRQAMEAADLRAQLDTARLQAGRAHDEDMALRTQLDAATKRAELAETTLESVRAAVAKPVEDKQDTRPKIGDTVPWSEMEDGLYHRPDYPYPFAMVVGSRVNVVDHDDRAVARMLDGSGRGQLVSSTDPERVVFVARDLGTDPEVWRAAMREHMAKVGK